MNRTLIYSTLNFNRKTVESAAQNCYTQNRKSFKTLLRHRNDEDLPHYLYFYLRCWKKNIVQMLLLLLLFIYIFFYQIWFTSLQLHAVTLESLKNGYNVCILTVCEKKSSYNINKKFSNTLQDCISFLHFTFF